MTILIKKKVLIEKTSKMFQKIGVDLFTDKIIFVTNNHAVLFYDGYETKCFLVLTFLKDDCSGDINNKKAIRFYEYAIKKQIDYGGMTFCNGHNFITSGFREVLTNNMDDDKVWLVIESLCEYGTYLSNNISEFINNKISIQKLGSSIKKDNTELLSIINNNSVKLTNRIFWEKYPRVEIIKSA